MFKSAFTGKKGLFQLLAGIPQDVIILEEFDEFDHYVIVNDDPAKEKELCDTVDKMMNNFDKLDSSYHFDLLPLFPTAKVFFREGVIISIVNQNDAVYISAAVEWRRQCPLGSAFNSVSNDDQIRAALSAAIYFLSKKD